MKACRALGAIAALIIILVAGSARAGAPEWVLGGLELNGYINVGAGFQHFSNDPVTAIPAEGPIGQWIPPSTIANAPPPAPGSDYFQFFIPKIEIDVVKHFGKRARLRADIQMGRPASGSSSGVLNIDHAYLVVRLADTYNVDFWIGRLALQAGYEPYQDYYNDTVSFSLLWRTIYPPATTTGAQISAVFNDNWSIYFSFGNGVINDSTVGRKTMPSFVTSLIYTWGAEIRQSNVVITGWWGPESGGNRPFSYGFDVTSTWYFAPRWLVGLEANWMRDDGAGGPTTDYAAGLFNLRWDFSKHWYGVIKYAYGRQFAAGNGSINKTGAKQQIHENSIALCYFIADSAKLKMEGRADVIVPAGGATQVVSGAAMSLNYAF